MQPFTWKNGAVPEKFKIKQVYGFVFTRDGRTLLRVPQHNGKDVYTLAGGRPEAFDKDMEATLRREFLEEVNTTLLSPVMVGYQIVNEGNGTPLYAQVRMTAIIDKIGPSQPDPDNGETHKRFLTTPKKAIKLLNWGKSGRKMIRTATRIAKKQLGIKTHLDQDEWV